jgi:RNA polymerase subunit RPABC4/transcription elongation factor Spt4
MVEGKKFLQFDTDRKLDFDFRRPLEFSPDRERAFDPKRTLSFDSTRKLPFGKHGTIFRGVVCPKCGALVMPVDTNCPECGNPMPARDIPKAPPTQQRPFQQQQQQPMDVRPLQQPQPPQPTQPIQPQQPMAQSMRPPQRQAPPSAASATGQVVCPNCALTLPAQTVYCPRCGVNIQQWRQYLLQMAQRGQNKGVQSGWGQQPPGR